MMRFVLNQLPIKHGTYTAEGYKIRRTFSNGFSYIASKCKSESEANRIVNQLNQLN
jgi:hypothetical protein